MSLSLTPEIRKYQTGDLILKQGDLGSNACRILQGEVEVYCNRGREKIVLGRLGPGEIFGEMGMIEDKPRSATVEALRPTEVEVVTPALFNQQILKCPDRLLPYLKSFFERLRRTNELSYPMQSAVNDQKSMLDASTIPVLRLEPTTEALRKKLPEGADLEIQKFPFRIGRWSENSQADVFVSNDLLIRDDIPYRISRNHCAIEREGHHFHILDRGSASGTLVNEQLIGGRESQMIAPLHSGLNTLQLGETDSLCRFHIHVP